MHTSTYTAPPYTATYIKSPTTSPNVQKETQCHLRDSALQQLIPTHMSLFKFLNEIVHMTNTGAPNVYFEMKWLDPRHI